MLAVDADNAALTTDQRGDTFVRVADDLTASGSGVDIGAFEVQPQLLIVDNATDIDDFNLTAGNLSLREAIRVANDSPEVDRIIFDENVFSAGDSIELTSQLDVTDSISISGPSDFNISIDGLNTTRLFAFNSSDAATYIIENLTLVNGSASDNVGGALSINDPDDTLLIRDVQFSNNSANGGGAIFVGEADYVIENSSFVSNNATFNGSAILVVGGSEGSIFNSTVSGNTSNNTGAALNLQTTGADTASISIINSTIADTTGSGVGVFAGGSSTAEIEIGNSIIADSSLANVTLGGTNGSFVSLGNNISDDGTGSFNGPNDLTNRTPQLADLALNGGNTFTHALLPTSPAIDAGNNALAVDGDGNALATDQRGEDRVFDGNQDGTDTVDIGAFERQAIGIAGAHVFYNNSNFDGSSNSDAIATDKVPLRNGETASFENYTSYSRGINGIAVDLVNAGTILTSDIGLRFGNSDDVATYATLDASSMITNLTTIAGAGVNGTDRVFIEFADGAITNGWLQVTFLANNNTGLTDDDVFYFGNAIGESGNDPADAIVNLADISGPRTNQTGFGTTDVENAFDFNRDAVVNLADLAIARTNQSGFTPIRLITPTESSGGQNDKLPPAATGTAAASVASPAGTLKSKVEPVEVVEVTTASTSELTTLEVATFNVPSFAVAESVQTATNGQSNGADQSDEALQLAPLALVGAGLDTAATDQDVLDRVFEKTGKENDVAVQVQLTDIDSLFESSFSVDL